jgi:hypothetical protein
LEKGEREIEEGEVGWRKKGEGQGPFGKTTIPFLPIGSEQRGGGDRGGLPARLRRLPALQRRMADGNMGKGKRGARAFYSRAHLGQGWLEEVLPRQGAAGGGG